MDISGVLNYRNVRVVFPLLLLTVAVYFASTVFLFIMEMRLAHYSPPLIHGPSSGSQKSSTLPTLREYRAILERNLFAIKTDESSKGKEGDLLANLDKLALTSLNCALIGTVIHEHGESWAIIKDNQSGKEEKVPVGAMFGEAKVVMILRNKVVLHFNGKDELLVMGIERIRAERLAQDKAGKEQASAEGSTYKISKDFVRNSMNDLAKIMSTMRVRPFIKDGKPQGFQISRLKEGSLVKTMGFEDGDIITSVNGQNILSPEDAMKLYNTLKDSSFFSITIIRKNQPVTLNYKVR
ncbi:MAG: type II secretion system protein GspC [Thermodesulfobacteriota bacterium]